MTQDTQSPTFNAYVVTRREGKEDWWMQIGAVFAHKDGDGFNVILQALPIPNGDGQCKIVLRPPKQQEDKQNNAPPNNANRRQHNANRNRNR